MSLITRKASASIDTVSALHAPQISGDLYAGEALDPVAPCYIKNADGLVYMSNGTALNEAAKIDGWTPQAYAIGASVTLLGIGVKAGYGASLSKGANLYLGATKGRLDDAPTTGGLVPIARVLHDGRTIRILRNSDAAGDGAVTAASLNGNSVAVVAESAVIGGIPIVFEIPIAAGALGDTDVVMTHKVRVLDAHLILRGAGVSTTTLTVKNGTNAITNAMAASGSDQAIVRAASIDDARYEIAAAGTLRVTSATGATQPDALVVVTAVRVA